MVNLDIAPYVTNPLFRVKQLFVNGACEPEIRLIGENSFLNQLLSSWFYHLCTPEDLVELIIEQTSNFLSILDFHAVVRIEPKDPVSRGLFNGLVPCVREVVLPRDI